MRVKCDISLGELVDKISILNIKSSKIKDKEKQLHVSAERTVLSDLLMSLKLKNIDAFADQLELVNLALWEIEDAIRDKERAGDFGAEFIKLARSVYQTNDKRFKIKNEINEIFGSLIKEVKSYQEY